jgi:hypothetical protein
LCFQAQDALDVLGFDEALIGQLKHVFDLFNVGVQNYTNFAPLINHAKVLDIGFKSQVILENMEGLRIHSRVVVEVLHVLHKDQVATLHKLVDSEWKRNGVILLL